MGDRAAIPALIKLVADHGGGPNLRVEAMTAFGTLADANVNVTFSYVATGNRVIIGASNVPKVAEILSKEVGVTR